MALAARGIARLLAGTMATALACPGRSHAETAAPGPAPAPAQLRLSLPAICNPDHPRAAQDSMGSLLRGLVDDLGRWQCGWSSAGPQWSDWTLTLWGGAMTAGNLGQSLTLEKGWRSEALGGLGVQRTLWKRGRVGLIVDANLLGHWAVDGASTPAQSFGEGTVGLGLKVYPTRWLALTVVEGLSVYTDRSREQLKRGGNGRQLVNYLAFEADAALNRQWSLVGRLHHRSGIYGTLNCITACDNNAYLLGLRYRFGAPQESAEQATEQPDEQPQEAVPAEQPSEPTSHQLELEQPAQIDNDAREPDREKPDTEKDEQMCSEAQVTSHDVGSDAYREDNPRHPWLDSQPCLRLEAQPPEPDVHPRSRS